VKRLFGHDEAVAAFLDALAGGRMHHAWLVSGPRGVGKATFADKAALRLLAEQQDPPAGFDVPDEHPAARLVAAGSHPDLMRLQRMPREGGSEPARNITVDQVRSLQRLFATAASIAPWRVVVVDAIDDLERAGANALLKNLEEPPARSVFLLVSHAPERLLPTIRSRCRHLRLGPLGDDAMTSALRQQLGDEEDAVEFLVQAGAGSVGRALAFRGLDVAGLDRELRDLASQGDPTNARRSTLVQSLSVKAARPRYEAFLERVPALIAETARQRRGPALAEAIGLWERASDLASGALRLSLDPQNVVFELSGMLAALAPQQADG
jgi:DNA polymerase-3 subunit delta'